MYTTWFLRYTTTVWCVMISWTSTIGRFGAEFKPNIRSYLILLQVNCQQVETSQTMNWRNEGNYHEKWQSVYKMGESSKANRSTDSVTRLKELFGLCDRIQLFEVFLCLVFRIHKSGGVKIGRKNICGENHSQQLLRSELLQSLRLLTITFATVMTTDFVRPRNIRAKS